MTARRTVPTLVRSFPHRTLQGMSGSLPQSGRLRPKPSPLLKEWMISYRLDCEVKMRLLLYNLMIPFNNWNFRRRFLREWTSGGGNPADFPKIGRLSRENYRRAVETAKELNLK